MRSTSASLFDRPAARRALPWLVPMVVLTAWQIASQSGWLSTRVLPQPGAVVKAFWSLAVSGAIWKHVAVSTWRALLGFAIGGGLGLAPGLTLGLPVSRHFKRRSEPDRLT